MAQRRDYSGGSRPRGKDRDYGEESTFQDRVVTVNRVAKVVKGGRRFGFNALVVVGDGAGRVGVALGKANEVSEAVRKGAELAKKGLFTFPIINGTIPHEVTVKKGAARIMLRPAAPGTGVIAGGAIRAIMELAGVQNVLSKVIGTNNPHNVLGATVAALRSLVRPEEAAARRGQPKPRTQTAVAAVEEAAPALPAAEDACDEKKPWKAKLTRVLDAEKAKGAKPDASGDDAPAPENA